MNKKKKTLILFFVIIGLLGQIKITCNYIQEKNNNMKMSIEMKNKEKEYNNQINKVLKEKKDIQKQINNLSEKNKKDYDTIKKLEKQVEEKNKTLDSMMKQISYNPYNIKEPSNATIFHLKKALKGTNMEQLAYYFVEAEKKYNINALFLAGLVATESAWNTSYRAINQNNLTGHAVYGTASRGSYFDSKEECILSTARLLNTKYLNPKGEYYNGVSVWNINQKYCFNGAEPNMEWSNMINNIASNLKNKANKGV